MFLAQRCCILGGDIVSGALLQVSHLNPLSFPGLFSHSQFVARPPSHANILWPFVVVLSSPAALLIGNTGLVRKYSESRCYGNNYGQHQNYRAGKIQLHILAKLRTEGMERQREKGRDGVLQKHTQISGHNTHFYNYIYFSISYFQKRWSLETQSITNQYETVIVVQTGGSDD